MITDESEAWSQSHLLEDPQSPAGGTAADTDTYPQDRGQRYIQPASFSANSMWQLELSKHQAMWY